MVVRGKLSEIPEISIELSVRNTRLCSERLLLRTLDYTSCAQIEWMIGQKFRVRSAILMC